MGLTDEGGISTHQQARGSLTCQPEASDAGHLYGDGFSGHVDMESVLHQMQYLQTGAVGWASMPHTSAYLRAAGKLPGGKEAGFTPSPPRGIFYCLFRCSSALHADFGQCQS